MEEYLAFGLLMLLVANVKQMCWRTVPEGHLYISYVHASACLGGGQSQIFLRLALALFVRKGDVTGGVVGHLSDLSSRYVHVSAFLGGQS